MWQTQKLNIKTRMVESFDDLYSVLTSYDKFNIIENIKLKPKYTMWSDLSSETKFALLRDGM